MNQIPGTRGDRYTTELHKETLRVNGWTFCPVDIMDADMGMKMVFGNVHGEKSAEL